MKILALDIETSPNVVYTWGLFQQNVALNQIISTSEVLCFAAKWIGKPGKPVFMSVHHDGKEAMLQGMHDLLDEADVVLHYNGRSFDMPHLQREFLEAGMPPPAPYADIDLYLVVRKSFRFQSKKLEHVSRQLGLEGKVKHEGFDLWRKVLEGDPKAWATMRKYNLQDVVLLEELYEILLPWITNHPSVPVHDGTKDPDRPACPRCGSEHAQRRGYAHTRASRFARYQCQGCLGWYRGASKVLPVAREL